MGKSRCSIVIPVHNKALLTRQCLDSILETPPAVSFELIVVDDASTDSTPELLTGYGEAVRVIRLDPNAGFGTACNTGAATGEGDYVLFLNNDTIPLPGWLDALVGYADRHPEAAVVGAKLLYEDGTIQHAGVVFSIHGDPMHIYAGSPADCPAVNKSRRFQCITAACALVRRSAFEEIGGFDTAYHNDLEDVDLCLKLGELGHEVHYCHEGVLYHLESASRGRSGSAQSETAFRTHWGRRVRGDELDYYREDGLLDLIRVAADQLSGETRQLDAYLSQLRSQQMHAMLREHIRWATEDPALRPSRLRRKTKSQFERLRADLAAPAFEHDRAKLESLEDEEPSRGGEPQQLAAAADEEAAEEVAREETQVPEPQPDSSGQPPEYDALVRRLRELVNLTVPLDATLLVLSKGDDELLEIEGHTAWHFPRAEDGRYAGYHPADSTAAIRHLEELRSKGADYLLLPSTAFWWLDHYEGFGHHLRSRYSLIAEEKSCLLFRLTEQSLAAVVRHLIPPRTTVALMGVEREELPNLDGYHVERLLLSPDGGDAGERVESVERRRAQFLVVSSAAAVLLGRRDDFARRLRAGHRLVTRQRGLCEIYELVPIVDKSLMAARSGNDPAESRPPKGWWKKRARALGSRAAR